jgi:nitronate monooxygenase
VVLHEIEHPVVLAPMAGGPSTVELARAVSDAGGLGFLAAGYRTAEEMRDQIRDMRGRRFGVNLFVPGRAEVDEAAVGEYVRSLGPGAGEPRFDTDGWRQKLDVLRDEEPVPVVSFVFGCPPLCEVVSLRAHGSEVWVTVTDLAEARMARDAGADVLVLQGIEAGGHRGSWVDRHRPGGPDGLGLLALLRLVAASDVDLPLVAAGGVSDAPSLAAVLAAGASAAQVGTAFMLAPEAGTHPAHREALADPEAATALTRAFTGRLARGIVNRFMEEHSAGAPIAYPQVHYATSPIRAAARERGDAGGFNLWAGQAHALAVERPASETLRALSSGVGSSVPRSRLTSLDQPRA